MSQTIINSTKTITNIITAADATTTTTITATTISTTATITFINFTISSVHIQCQILC